MKKKLKLILLSTDKAIREVRDGYYKNVLSLNNTKYDKSLELFRTIDGIKVPNPQHLYAISDEKPKVGDWFLYDNKLFNDFKCSLSPNTTMFVRVYPLKDYGERYDEVYIKDCKKVIITTDDSLTYIEHDYTVPYPKGKQITVPTFTNDFLDTYIKKYNDGEVLEFVEVEYDCDHFQMPNKVIDVLKVNSDNTVDVSLIEDKLYTKKELVNKLLIYKADLLVELMRCRESNRTLQTEFTNNWIKQNL